MQKTLRRWVAYVGRLPRLVLFTRCCEIALSRPGLLGSGDWTRVQDGLGQMMSTRPTMGPPKQLVACQSSLSDSAWLATQSIRGMFYQLYLTLSWLRLTDSRGLVS